MSKLQVSDHTFALNPEVADILTTETKKVAARLNKYNARKTEIDGVVYDSGKEARRHQELILMAKSGLISELEVKPAFILQEAFRDAYGRWHRKISYEADYAYTQDGQRVVEDTKGGKATQTDAFRMRFKMAQKKYPDCKFVVVE